MRLVRSKNKYTERTKEFDVKNNQIEVPGILRDLDEALATHKKLMYVCANEIGRSERVINIRSENENITMFNPVYRLKEGLRLVREKDRLTGKEYIIPRWSKVQLMYLDYTGEPKCTYIIEDDFAYILCQAMDVLDCLFTSDYGLPILPGFDEATDEERAEILNNYMHELSAASAKLDEELISDEATRQEWEASKYLNKLISGEIENNEEQKELSNRQKKKIEKILKKAKQTSNKLKFWKKLGIKKDESESDTGK